MVDPRDPCRRWRLPASLGDNRAVDRAGPQPLLMAHIWCDIPLFPPESFIRCVRWHPPSALRRDPRNEEESRSDEARHEDQTGCHAEGQEVMLPSAPSRCWSNGPSGPFRFAAPGMGPNRRGGRSRRTGAAAKRHSDSTDLILHALSAPETLAGLLRSQR
jgi:hypothetical protein